MDVKIPEDLPGPILLGGFLQSFLLGTIVNQAFKYLMDYRNDSRQKRVFVAFVMVLSIAQTILEDYKVWRTLILHKRWSTSSVQWSDVLLNGMICWLCEAYYIRRSWKMMEKKFWVLAPLSTLSVITLTANLYLAIAMGILFSSGVLQDTNDTLTASRFLLPSSVIAFSVWIFGSLVLESTVSTILMISLWKSRTGLKEIDKTVIKIIHMTWETASPPALCMLVAVGLYHAQPRTDDHLVLFFVLLTGKFYAFGMLRTLNSRQKLRESMSSHELGRTTLTTSEWDQVRANIADSSGNNPAGVASSEEFPTSTNSAKSMAVNDSSSEDAAYPFASTFDYIGTPAMDAQETGVVRHRNCSRGKEQPRE